MLATPRGGTGANRFCVARDAAVGLEVQRDAARAQAAERHPPTHVRHAPEDLTAAPDQMPADVMQARHAASIAVGRRGIAVCAHDGDRELDVVEERGTAVAQPAPIEPGEIRPALG